MDHQEAPVDGLPTTHWETQTEFLSPDFAPPIQEPLWIFGE